MAIDVLQGDTSKPHGYYHDLESLFYVLIWICITQKEPNGLARTESEFNFKKSPLWDWYNLNDNDDETEPSLMQIGSAKLGQMGLEWAFTRRIISSLPDYFKPLSKLLLALRSIFFRQNPSYDIDIEAVLDKDRCISERDPEKVLAKLNKVLDTALEELSKRVEPDGVVEHVVGGDGKTYSIVVNSSIPPLSTCCLEAVPYRTRAQVKKEKEAATSNLTSGGSGLAKVAMENAFRSSTSKRQYDQEETTPSGSSSLKRSKRN